jgi:hypothetical protein
LIVVPVALLRKRIQSAIEAGRRGAAERRQRAAAASRAYETFLNEMATPAFRQVANVLRAEGLPFDVQTPLNGVHLVFDRARDDRIELELDTSTDPPSPMLIVTRTRGGRLLRAERPVKEGAAIETITEDELIERLIDELRPWLE